MARRTWADVGIEIPPGTTGEILTPCPQCSPRRKKKHAKCLRVWLEDENYFCHHCGWSGSLRTGERTPSGEPGYGEPLRNLYVRPRPARPLPETASRDRMLAWFAGRGIPEAVVARHGVAITRAWFPDIEEERNAIAWPYRRHGELVNYKYRDHEKHFAMVPRAERILYGLDDCVGAERVVIVEGELDAMALEVAGITTVLSVPNGAPGENVKSLETALAYLGEDTAAGIFREATEIVLACDADGPGQRLTEELSRRFGRAKCRRVTWPDGIKDANEALSQVGASFLADCIEEAEPYPVEGVVYFEELLAEVLRYYDEGMPRGVSTGWPTLDDHYRVLPGTVTVIVSQHGIGKSTWLDALLVNLARLHGWTFGICSPEYKPLARHAIGLLTAHTGKPFDRLATFPRMARTEVGIGIAELGKRFAFIDPKMRTIGAIVEAAEGLHLSMGMQGLIVDPWNQMDHRRPDTKNLTEYASEVMGALGDLARDHLLHIWLVTHPTKLQKDRQTGRYPVPTMIDINGSGAFGDKADFGLALYRDKEDDSAPLEIHVQKSRYREVARIGRVELGFEHWSGRFIDQVPLVPEARYAQQDL